MNNLRKYIRRLLKESEEKELTPEQEVANIMQVWDADEWEMAQELAYMLGPKIIRHPDLKIWYIMNGVNGDVVIADLNYDQAMDPKYQTFVIFDGGYEVMDNNPDSPYHGRKVGSGSARDYPPKEEDFLGAKMWLDREGMEVEVLDVDDESFSVAVEMVPV